MLTPFFAARNYSVFLAFQKEPANLNRWASEGKDMNVALPYLMRYMGHATVSSTLYYFHFVPGYYKDFAQKAHALECLIPEVPNEER
jgi:hypothetical protein